MNAQRLLIKLCQFILDRIYLSDYPHRGSISRYQVHWMTFTFCCHTGLETEQSIPHLHLPTPDHRHSYFPGPLSSTAPSPDIPHRIYSSRSRMLVANFHIKTTIFTNPIMTQSASPIASSFKASPQLTVPRTSSCSKSRLLSLHQRHELVTFN